MMNINNIRVQHKVGTGYTDTRFEDDRIYIEEGELDNYLYSGGKLIDTTTKAYGMTEQCIGFDKDFTPFYITVSKTQYQDTIQTSVSVQELSLYGVNSIVKRLNEPELDECFIRYSEACLNKNNIDISYDDLMTLAIYNPEFKVSILELEDDNHKVWVTVQDKMLKKITKKLVKTTNKCSIKSSLGAKLALANK